MAHTVEQVTNVMIFVETVASSRTSLGFGAVIFHFFFDR